MAPTAAPTPQPPLTIARRKRMIRVLEQIFRGDETEQRAVAPDERELLDLMRGHEALSVRQREQQENEMAISFAKLVQIVEEVEVDNDFDVAVFVEGNSALANAQAEADALGPDSFTATLALTTTSTVFHVGSASSSIEESLSLDDM